MAEPGESQDSADEKINPSGGRRSRAFRVSATAITVGGARGTLMLGTLLTVPLVLRELGQAQLGVWLTLVTFTTLLGFADLGLGNGVMTTVAEASAANDHAQIRSVVTNGYAALTGVAFVVGLAVLLAGAATDFSAVLGLPARDEGVHMGVTISALLFVATTPFTITEKMQWGLQQGYIAGMWGLAASMVTIGAVVLALAVGWGFRGIAIVYTGVPLLFAMANTVWSFMARFSALRPRRSHIALNSMVELLGIGGWYFMLQLSAALAFSSDNIVVAAALGAESVPQLAIPARLFGLVSFGITLFLRPLWPEYARAIAGNEIAWVRRTLYRSTILSGGLALAGSLFVLAVGREITSILIGPSAVPEYGLFWWLSALTVATTVGTAISMLYNAASIIRFQAFVALVMTALVVVGKVALAGKLGVVGVVAATAVGYVAVVGPAMIWYTPHVLARLDTYRGRGFRR